ncbi:unnamed protein product [Rotaria sordida]|uniref:EF-hand domain-containing protein n=1 Tax=Rotaria sordida TaxID=392033 RepID=A0A814AM42_9BILA|nr:unnamed protein product [Rotaria sordida]CAF0830266.1 unnamed protein product [Rotaria sordida]CAF0852568.1 unnamed protein product [Rotaria sordida]CAF0866317.1 unnamed protein product [Rotaria sordida]CAF0913899.1 unnamed protein product [Rotaria sordida]
MMHRLRHFKSDNELTSTLPVQIRKVPKSLEEIVRITKFNKSEIRLLYKGFKQECPSGAVTEREFQAIYSHFFPHGNCQYYTTYLFRVLDRRKRMYFTFEDYIQTLSILVRGSIKEKLQWIFRFYDISDAGKLTKQTIETILHSIYNLLGPNNCLHQPLTDATIEKHSALIFEKLDFHHVGSINFDDFENYCLHDEQLLNTIKLLSTTTI